MTKEENFKVWNEYFKIYLTINLDEEDSYTEAVEASIIDADITFGMVMNGNLTLQEQTK